MKNTRSTIFFTLAIGINLLGISIFIERSRVLASPIIGKGIAELSHSKLTIDSTIAPPNIDANRIAPISIISDSIYIRISPEIRRAEKNQIAHFSKEISMPDRIIVDRTKTGQNSSRDMLIVPRVNLNCVANIGALETMGQHFRHDFIVNASMVDSNNIHPIAAIGLQQSIAIDDIYSLRTINQASEIGYGARQTILNADSISTTTAGLRIFGADLPRSDQRSINWDIQALQEVREYLSREGRAWEPMENTFGKISIWLPGWELRWWSFRKSDGTQIWVYHTRSEATNQRFMSYIEPNTGRLQRWESIK